MPGYDSEEENHQNRFKGSYGICVIFEEENNLFVPKKLISGNDFGFDGESDYSREYSEVLRIGDMTGDARKEVVILEAIHGSTNHGRLLAIGRWDGEQWVNLVGKHHISHQLSSIRFDDIDGSGTTEVVMEGGLVVSNGAGLQRSSTIVFGFIDGAFNVINFDYEPSEHPYHMLVDAGRALRDGNPEKALQLAEIVLAMSVESIAGHYWVTRKHAERIFAYAHIQRMMALANTGRVGEALSGVDSLWGLDPQSNPYIKAASDLANSLGGWDAEGADPCFAYGQVEKELEEIPEEELSLLEHIGYRTEALPNPCEIE